MEIKTKNVQIENSFTNSFAQSQAAVHQTFELRQDHFNLVQNLKVNPQKLH
jgi:hypothetical protein